MEQTIYTNNNPLADTFLNITPVLEKTADIALHPKQLANAVFSSTSFFIFQMVLFALSVIFFIGIVLLISRINEMTAKARKEAAAKGIRLAKVKSKRWEEVEKYMQSENPAEWKVAIMEADAMLEAMVKRMGYPGKTLGEMMKQIEKSDFVTLDDAWEAHKVRNYIAHQGSSFLLTKHQANRVIRLYERVFREFEYI